MNSLIIAVNAVIPFLFYLLFGAFARRIGVVTEEFLQKLNTMLFSLMFPFVTFYNIYSADAGMLPSRTLLLFIPLSILILQMILFLVVPRLVAENKKRGVIIQAIYRSNILLFALPLVISIYGEEAASATSMVITVVITIYNITSVIILEYFRSTNEISNRESAKTSRAALAKDIARNVIKNPLLDGACVGLIFFLLGIHLPSCIETPIEAIADLTSPLALFTLGGTLKLSSMRHNAKYLVPSLTVRLVIAPAILVALGYLLGLRSLELFLVLCTFGTPIAVASYPMAQNMGGDGELAGQFVVLSTIASVFTLFLWIFFMSRAGIL